MTGAGPTRRQALCGLALGLLAPGVFAAACGTGPTRAGGAGSARPGTRIASVSDVPVGGGALVNVGTDGLVLLTAPRSGEIEAFDPTCPHAGATVAPPQGGVITCPAHGSQFDPTSGALERGPAQRGLTRVAVTVRAGSVLLA